MARAPDMVLFDFDGTISDPIVGTTNSINYALEAFGFDTLTSSKVAEFIGPPIDQTFKSITGITADAQIQDLVRKYLERISEIGYSEVTLYLGIPDALKFFSDANVRMAVCTSKRADFAEKILAMIGLQNYFDFINGGDFGVQKWQQISDLKKGGEVSNATVMVGDLGSFGYRTAWNPEIGSEGVFGDRQFPSCNFGFYQ